MKIKSINHITSFSPGDVNNWAHLFNAIMSISKINNTIFAFSYLEIKAATNYRTEISMYDQNNEIFATITSPNFFPRVGNKECQNPIQLIGTDPVKFFVFGYGLLSENNKILLNEEGAFLIVDED